MSRPNSTRFPTAIPSRHRDEASACMANLDAIGYVQFHSRSADAVIRVYDEAENVIETHKHKGDFKEP